MNEKFLEGLVTLFLPKKQVSEFLSKLKNADEEFLSDDEILGLIKGVAQKRISSKEAFGRKQRWEQIAGILKNDYELELEDDVEASEAFKLLVEKVKSGVEPKETIIEKELTKENALNNPIVLELVNAAKKKAADGTKTEMQEIIKNLQTTIATQKEKQNDIALKKAIRKITTKDKYNLGDKEEQKEIALETLMLIAKAKGGRFIQDTDKTYTDDPESMLLADKNGNAVVDDFGQAVTLQEFLKSNSPFGQHKFDKNKGGAQATTTNSQQQRQQNADNPYKYDVTKPGEFSAAYQEEKDPEKKKLMAAAWKEAKAATES